MRWQLVIFIIVGVWLLLFFIVLEVFIIFVAVLFSLSQLGNLLLKLLDFLAQRLDDLLVVLLLLLKQFYLFNHILLFHAKLLLELGLTDAQANVISV